MVSLPSNIALVTIVYTYLAQLGESDCIAKGNA